jgi:hypothetical protein
MIYFDFDMSKSTNMVVYFDWKTVIYIYVCGQCRTQFMLPNSSACANEIIPNRTAGNKMCQSRSKQLEIKCVNLGLNSWK